MEESIAGQSSMSEVIKVLESIVAKDKGGNGPYNSSTFIVSIIPIPILTLMLVCPTREVFFITMKGS